MSKKLFSLVKSLTPSEKARFKKDATFYSKSKKASYIDMFDLLNRQDVYSEAALIKAFGKSGLAAQKSYLYKNLIKSVGNHSTVGSLNYKIKELFKEFQILDNRELTAEAVKCAKKAVALCVQIEDFTTMLSLVKKIGYRYIDKSKENIEEQLLEWQKLESEILVKLGELNDYNFMVHHLHFEQSKKFYYESEEEISKAKEKYFVALTSDPNERKSVRAKLNQLLVCAGYYQASQEFDKYFEYSKKHYQLFIDNPELLQNRFTEFLRAVNNYGQSCKHTENSDKHLIELINDLEMLPIPKFKNNALLLQRAIIINSISYHLVRYEDNEVYLYSNKLMKIAEAIGDLQGRHIELNIIKNNVFFAMYLGYFSRALESANRMERLCNEIGGLKNIEKKTVFLLLFIIHYELKNYSLLESLMRSHTRKNEGGRMMSYELAIIKFFKKSMYELDKKKVNESLKTLKMTLSDLESDDEERPYVNDFTYDCWIDSKLKGITMTEMFKLY